MSFSRACSASLLCAALRIFRCNFLTSSTFSCTCERNNCILILFSKGWRTGTPACFAKCKQNLQCQFVYWLYSLCQKSFLVTLLNLYLAFSMASFLRRLGYQCPTVWRVLTFLVTLKDDPCPSWMTHRHNFNLKGRLDALSSVYCLFIWFWGDSVLFGKPEMFFCLPGTLLKKDAHNKGFPLWN